MRIYMQSNTDTHSQPRFYHIHLSPDLLGGWLLTKEWGSQGSSGRIQKIHFDNIEEAELEIENTRDAQIKRGYQVVFIQGQN